MSVDLPHPELPRIMRISPFLTSNEMSFNTVFPS